MPKKVRNFDQLSNYQIGSLIPFDKLSKEVFNGASLTVKNRSKYLKELEPYCEFDKVKDGIIIILHKVSAPAPCTQEVLRTDLEDFIKSEFNKRLITCNDPFNPYTRKQMVAKYLKANPAMLEMFSKTKIEQIFHDVEAELFGDKTGKKVKEVVYGTYGVSWKDYANKISDDLMVLLEDGENIEWYEDWYNPAKREVDKMDGKFANDFNLSDLKNEPNAYPNALKAQKAATGMVKIPVIVAIPYSQIPSLVALSRRANNEDNRKDD